MIDLLLTLEQRRYSWPVEEAAAEFEVDPRTIKRYVDALGSRLVTEDGRPAIEIKHKGRRPCIIVNRPTLVVGPGIYDYAALYLAKSILEALLPAGLIHESLERLTRELAGAVESHAPGRLSAIERIPQIFKVSAHKNDGTEEEASDVLSEIVSSLVLERRVEIRLRDRSEHAIVIEPLSLSVSGNGLSLHIRGSTPDIGKSTVELTDILSAELKERMESSD